MKTHNTTARVLLGLAAVGALALTGCGGNDTDQGAPSPTDAPSTTPTAPAPMTTFGDGSYVIGPDVAPGTYHTDGLVAGSTTPCTWERDADTEGKTVLAHDSVTGPTTVVILAGDGGFKTNGCQPWNPGHGK
jgi:hypothetical protein